MIPKKLSLPRNGTKSNKLLRHSIELESKSEKSESNEQTPQLLSLLLGVQQTPSPYCLIKWKKSAGPTLCSQVRYSTTNPIWNETFSLRYDEDIEGEALQIFVMNHTSDKNTYEHELIGFVEIPLEQLQSSMVSEMMKEKELVSVRKGLCSLVGNEDAILSYTSSTDSTSASVLLDKTTSRPDSAPELIKARKSSSQEQIQKAKCPYKIFALAGVFPPEKGEIAISHIHRCWSCNLTAILVSMAFAAYFANSLALCRFCLVIITMVLLSGHIRQITRFFYGREYLCYEIHLNISDHSVLQPLHWCKTYKSARLIFTNWPHALFIRFLTHLQHYTLYAENFVREGIITQGEDFLRLINYGIRRYDSKPVAFTFVINKDKLRFSMTSHEWFDDRLSKHGVHANASPYIQYSGIFRVLYEDNSYVLFVDNDSGTYAPPDKDLTHIIDIFRRNFPGLKIEGCSIFSKRHKEVTDSFEKLKKKV